MVALYAVWYNFVKMHKTLRMTPAVASGVSDRLWSMTDLAEIIDATLPKPGKRGPYKHGALMMLHPSPKWTAALARQPETGMGYVICTVGLKDGRTFDCVMIVGGVITQCAGSKVIPFDEDEIKWIKATHDKAALRISN